MPRCLSVPASLPHLACPSPIAAAAVAQRQGIRVRLHDLAETKDIQLRVDSSRKSLLLVRGMTAQKVSLGSLTEVKRGKATEVFKKKDKLKVRRVGWEGSVLNHPPR